MRITDSTIYTLEEPLREQMLAGYAASHNFGPRIIAAWIETNIYKDPTRAVQLMEGYRGDLKNLPCGTEEQTGMIIFALKHLCHKMAQAGILHGDIKSENIVCSPKPDNINWQEVEMRAIDFDPKFVKFCPYISANTLELVNMTCILAHRRCWYKKCKSEDILTEAFAHSLQKDYVDILNNQHAQENFSRNFATISKIYTLPNPDPTEPGILWINQTSPNRNSMNDPKTTANAFLKFISHYLTGQCEDFEKYYNDHGNDTSMLEILLKFLGKNTTIFESIRNGNLADVTQHIHDGEDVNQVNDDNNTPLIVAVRRRHTDIIAYLLGIGANVNAVGNDNQTALRLASFNGHVDIVKLLLAAEPPADVNQARNDGTTALMQASLASHAAIVEMLLAAGADVNQTDDIGKTALTMAGWQSHAAVVEVLLAAGAAVNHADNRGATALMGASTMGYAAVVTLLLTAGANVNHADNYGNTALIEASQNGSVDIIAALLAAGANVNHANNNGQTALSEASRNGNIAVAALLRAAGAR
jgi:ankyrin repeat protein